MRTVNSRNVALLSAMLIGLGGAALAQLPVDEVTPGEGIAEQVEMPSRSVATSNEPYSGTLFGVMQADDVIGMTVVDAEGVDVGVVSDLLIGTDNEIDSAIIDVGGTLGFGTKPVAVDVRDLTIAEGDGEIVLDVTRVELEGMPEWQSSEDGWFSD